jgi:hypothetical protein
LNYLLDCRAAAPLVNGADDEQMPVPPPPLTLAVAAPAMALPVGEPGWSDSGRRGPGRGLSMSTCTGSGIEVGAAAAASTALVESGGHNSCGIHPVIFGVASLRVATILIHAARTRCTSAAPVTGAAAEAGREDWAWRSEPLNGNDFERQAKQRHTVAEASGRTPGPHRNATVSLRFRLAAYRYGGGTFRAGATVFTGQRWRLPTPSIGSPFLAGAVLSRTSRRSPALDRRGVFMITRVREEPEHVAVVSADGEPVQLTRIGRRANLVIVHGGMDSAKNWLPVAKVFAPHHRIWPLDRRPADPANECSPDRKVDDRQVVLAFLDLSDLPISSAVLFEPPLTGRRTDRRRTCWT